MHYSCRGGGGGGGLGAWSPQDNLDFWYIFLLCCIAFSSTVITLFTMLAYKRNIGNQVSREANAPPPSPPPAHACTTDSIASSNCPHTYKLHELSVYVFLHSTNRKLLSFREMFHGQRWRNDPFYQAPMVQTNSLQVYVGDFVGILPNPSVGISCAKVTRFYMKVIYIYI